MALVTELDTPAVTVRLDIVERNIRRVHGHLARHGIANRPHVKTHKIPALGRLQMAAGAVGITCQKLGEVEVFSEAGVADDVLLTYNLIGRAKIERLLALSRRLRRLAVVFDNEVVARGLAEGARAAGAEIPFLVECDTGYGRNGVQTPETALELARAARSWRRTCIQSRDTAICSSTRRPPSSTSPRSTAVWISRRAANVRGSARSWRWSRTTAAPSATWSTRCTESATARARRWGRWPRAAGCAEPTARYDHEPMGSFLRLRSTGCEAWEAKMSHRDSVSDRIRRLIATVFIVGLAVPGQALAGGIGAYEIGSADVGLASAGFGARAQDASTIWTNPAGMTRLEGTQILLGPQLLYGNLSFTIGPGTSAALGTNNGGNPIGWFPSGGTYFTYSVSKDLKLGFGAAGTFGLGEEYEAGWVGRYYNQSATLLGISLLPSIAYRLNDKFSVGLAVNVMYGVLKEQVAINNRGSGPDGELRLDANAWGAGV